MTDHVLRPLTAKEERSEQTGAASHGGVVSITELVEARTARHVLLGPGKDEVPATRHGAP